MFNLMSQLATSEKLAQTNRAPINIISLVGAALGADFRLASAILAVRHGSKAFVQGFGSYVAAGWALQPYRPLVLPLLAVEQASVAFPAFGHERDLNDGFVPG